MISHRLLATAALAAMPVVALAGCTVPSAHAAVGPAQATVRDVAQMSIGPCRTKVYLTQPTSHRVKSVESRDNGTFPGTVDVFRADGHELSLGEPLYIQVQTLAPGNYTTHLAFDHETYAVPVSTSGC